MNYAFFIGCKIPYYVPHYETAVRSVCGELSIGLTDVEFNCCGYPMRHFDFASSVLAAELFSTANSSAACETRIFLHLEIWFGWT